MGIILSMITLIRYGHSKIDFRANLDIEDDVVLLDIDLSSNKRSIISNYFWTDYPTTCLLEVLLFLDDKKSNINFPIFLSFENLSKFKVNKDLNLAQNHVFSSDTYSETETLISPFEFLIASQLDFNKLIEAVFHKSNIKDFNFLPNTLKNLVKTGFLYLSNSLILRDQIYFLTNRLINDQPGFKLNYQQRPLLIDIVNTLTRNTRSLTAQQLRFNLFQEFCSQTVMLDFVDLIKSSPEDFLSWVHSNSSTPHLNNFSSQVLGLRHDLANIISKMPNLQTKEDFLNSWYTNYGVNELKFQYPFPSPFNFDNKSNSSYFFTLKSEKGNGILQGAKYNLEHLHSQGLYTVDITNNASQNENTLKNLTPLLDNQSECYLNFNGDQYEHYLGNSYKSHFQNVGFSSTGYWAWELDCPPTRFAPGLDYVNRILVPTKFVQKSVSKMTDLPIYVLPHIVKIEGSLPQLPNDLIFYAFDYHSDIHRKNPQALISAFKALFPREQQNFKLVIKTQNADFYWIEHDLLMKLSDYRSDIEIIDEYWARSRVITTILQSRVVVSPHRSEGFGLICAEAIALGVPVIATGYGGNSEFMSEDSLVDYENVEIPRESHQYGAYRGLSKWGDINVNELCVKLDRIINDPDYAKRNVVANKLTMINFYKTFERNSIFDMSSKKNRKMFKLW
jgi:glycosyltransferase involved in cell wall biosynthesis